MSPVPLPEPSRPLDASHELWLRAREVLPGGAAVIGVFLDEPHPIYFARHDGAYIWDVDGNRYLDLRSGYAGLALGSAPEIRQAVIAQAQESTHLYPSTEKIIELSQLICEAIPSVERLHFTDSITKATNMAVRIGRAYTGREKFAKFIGAYHGVWDGAFFGVPARMESGPVMGKAVRGIPRSAEQDIVLLPFNDLPECRRIIEANAADLGSVLVEPVIGDGYIIPSDGFLQGIRELCDEHGIVLIADEAITLGLSPAGSQGFFGWDADLTAMGKLMGGSLPIGALGGREEILAVADPSRGTPVPDGSTFGAHPLSIAAGIASLKLMTPAVYARLREVGRRVRDGVAEIARRRGLPELSATGVGQFVNLHWNPAEVRRYEDHLACDRDVVRAVDRGMLWEGYCGPGYGRMHLSAAMTDADIDGLLLSLEKQVLRVREFA
jgi:glutamate-1-semialdehyde 2,1-aminomutase